MERSWRRNNKSRVLSEVGRRIWTGGHKIMSTYRHKLHMAPASRVKNTPRIEVGDGRSLEKIE
jgi:hypothetical protein